MSTRLREPLKNVLVGFLLWATVKHEAVFCGMEYVLDKCVLAGMRAGVFCKAGRVTRYRAVRVRRVVAVAGSVYFLESL